MSVENLYPLLFDIFGKVFEHHPGCERAGGCRPSPGIMVRLIANIRSIPVMGKGDSQAHEVEKSLGGILGFTQRDIPMHTAAVKQVSGHLKRRIRDIS